MRCLLATAPSSLHDRGRISSAPFQANRSDQALVRADYSLAPNWQISTLLIRRPCLDQTSEGDLRSDKSRLNAVPSTDLFYALNISKNYFRKLFSLHIFVVV